jgi:hypothetical protein
MERVKIAASRSTTATDIPATSRDFTTPIEEIGATCSTCGSPDSPALWAGWLAPPTAKSLATEAASPPIVGLAAEEPHPSAAAEEVESAAREKVLLLRPESAKGIE